MAEISGLSKKEIQEEYEDLVFRKVMAIYVQKEGKQILSEIEEEKKNDDTVVDSKAIIKLYDKKERKENLNILWKYSKKLINFTAMIVFVAIISLSSAVVAFADVREAVAEALYHLMLEENDDYTRVSVGDSSNFINPEVYDWEGAYAPTYMPEDFYFTDKIYTGTGYYITYSKEEKYILFYQDNSSVAGNLDTEDAEIVEKITIGDSEGIYIFKQGYTIVSWNMGDTLFILEGTADTGEMVEIARSIKILK